ncbi:MAG: hypothetical protein QOF19_1938 [Alphaproteobacteria bacterium]|jgi:hypothetical protein|nr:hypothetical protein [Alphaproteobacteria bacterium]
MDYDKIARTKKAKVMSPLIFSSMRAEKTLAEWEAREQKKRDAERRKKEKLQAARQKKTNALLGDFVNYIELRFAPFLELLAEVSKYPPERVRYRPRCGVRHVDGKQPHSDFDEYRYYFQILTPEPGGMTIRNFVPLGRTLRDETFGEASVKTYMFLGYNFKARYFTYAYIEGKAYLNNRMEPAVIKLRAKSKFAERVIEDLVKRDHLMTNSQAL